MEYLWWRERGRPLRPDVVVLALYVGNDIVELLLNEVNFGGYGPRFRVPWLSGPGGGFDLYYPSAQLGILGAVDWFAETHSRLYALARRVVERRSNAQVTPLAALAATCPGCLQTMAQAYVARGDVANLSDGFDKLDYLIQQLDAETRQNASRLLVVVIPTKLEVEPDTVRHDVETAYGTMGLRYSAEAFDDEVRARMAGLAARRGVAVVDLLAPLRAAAVLELRLAPEPGRSPRGRRRPRQLRGAGGSGCALMLGSVAP
jgi:hypothetical protein